MYSTRTSTYVLLRVPTRTPALSSAESGGAGKLLAGGRTRGSARLIQQQQLSAPRGMRNGSHTWVSFTDKNPANRATAL